jgi:hypothetical protein
MASSASLFADKLLSRTAEIASARWWRRRIRYRRAGGRDVGTQAGHCLRVTIDLTCSWVGGVMGTGFTV